MQEIQPEEQQKDEDIPNVKIPFDLVVSENDEGVNG